MKATTIDGNTAVCHVAYAFSELATIYPITPSSPMAELADEWSVDGRKNLFGQTVTITEMQSEAGVAGALHGALSCGALATTFTCSQGLLLMIPNMYKIAGELLPTVIHVSARALATHALSIFGDHQDVMACRQTGFAMLCSSSVQETADFALVSHLATLEASVPFLHFFDGFRTSHEMAKIQLPEYEEMEGLLNKNAIKSFKKRALSPERPLCKGTAQNPNIYFQNREACNPYYSALPKIVQSVMDKVSAVTGRKYALFDYYGDENAERVLVMMGSGLGTAEETVDYLNANGENVGVIKVRLYRPFDISSFINAIPKTCKKIAVLDKTKEAGSIGEPLYLDVSSALLQEGRTDITVVGGRYGLGQKEFTPTDCLAVFENLRLNTPKNGFTVGICDDVSGTSLQTAKKLTISFPSRVSCKFYGLGSDGTVGANKNSIKIIGEHTDLNVQAYFAYDSKKSGGITLSHLRFDKQPIKSAYLIQNADFTACHNPSYLTRLDMLASAKDGGAFLLNCPWTNIDDLEKYLPDNVKREIACKNLTFYVIDATKIAVDCGLSGRTSTIMQTAFFAVNPQIMPFDEAKFFMREEICKKFKRKGEKVIESNLQSMELVENAIVKINYPDTWKDLKPKKGINQVNSYLENFIEPILTLKGDFLPVSAFQADGSVPIGTTKLEKHGVARLLPKWIKENCIQCNQCSFTCPHATIRPIMINSDTVPPKSFETVDAIGIKNAKFRVQIVAEKCMGCGVCAEVCPAKEKALVMTPTEELLIDEIANWEFACKVEKADTSQFKKNTIKGSQFAKPLFEFSYACSGCGETPYIKLLTQLFGEKLLIANATGCSSIYGGSAPTCPYTTTENGRGPAWANSLFEDNAEFGLGMRLAQNLQEKGRSVWAIGGDGWAYDIGFGGVDHVLASKENVNILVLDSEVYSNTGGQTSKATPLGAVARFSSAGKQTNRKDLGFMAMTYQNAYVASVAMGANKQQLINAFIEAESYNGPSIIIAYSPCIAHGVAMGKSMEEQRLAVACGHRILYRYNPALKKDGKCPLIIDSKITMTLKDFYLRENRFASLHNTDKEKFDRLCQEAENANRDKYTLLEKLQ